LATVQDKLAWLDAVTQRVQQFVREGGDLKSVEAAPLGMALFHALNDLGREFGVQPPRASTDAPGPVPPKNATCW
jgi:hypothetical protein